MFLQQIFMKLWKGMSGLLIIFFFILSKQSLYVQVNPVVEAQAAPLMTKLKSLPPDRRIFQFIKDEQFYLVRRYYILPSELVYESPFAQVITFVPDEKLGVRVDFHLFSASESRLTLLELDVEQVWLWFRMDMSI